ncbi:MAG: hypothetical protein HRT58_03840 [Crocinitomicaceae bacterium]|nr:hypothetical protein [Flavobacteriales bacterium]NQZ34766.1 hypothetical protein [Crocinitomicaceae bacterium]
MKKNILFLSAFCLFSTISIAGGPDEPILSIPTTECQLMMMPRVDQSTKSVLESQEIMLVISDGCLRYAVLAAYAEQAYYGTSGEQELLALANEYYFACKFAGGAGHMLEPIFLP